MLLLGCWAAADGLLLGVGAAAGLLLAGGAAGLLLLAGDAAVLCRLRCGWSCWGAGADDVR